MRRSVPILLLLALLVTAALGAGRSGAAFVDAADTDSTATADTVDRWLGLEAPAAATCAAPADSAVDGIDADAALAVGGPALADAGSRTVDCALVLRARATLPEGATQITVAVAPDPEAAGQPVTGAQIAALDGSAPAASAVVPAGEARALRLTVQRGDVAAGRVLVSVGVGGETPGFLRYSVPVAVCEDALATSCVAPDPEPEPEPEPTPTPIDTPPGETPGEQPPVVEPPIFEEPSTDPPCTPRAPFRINLPRRAGRRVVGVTLNGRPVAVRRGRRPSALIDLRSLPANTMARVVITYRTRSGRLIRSTKTYSTCAPTARCVSRRAITIKLPRGTVSARVTVAGKAVKVRRRAGRLSARIDLANLRGRAVSVRIVRRTASGARRVSTQSILVCPGPPS